LQSNTLKNILLEEAVAKLHDFEKSMILDAPCPDPRADPHGCDEDILEKVGKSPPGQGAPKGRFCMAKSFAIASEGRFFPFIGFGRSIILR
jgi:hypothetical protein